MRASTGLPMSVPANEAEVSVIMPAYNAAAFVSQAVASVRAQTHRNWRLYLVDDGSQDDTETVVRDLAAQDQRIRLMRLPVRSGAANARNTAIRAATGRYVAFLDADDFWAPEKVSRQLAFADARGAAFSFTGYWRGGQNGRWRYVPAPSTVSHDGLLRANVIGCLTAMYDRTVMGSIEMPALHRRQDYAFWLKLLERTPLAHGLDQGLAGYRRGLPNALSGGIVSAQRANWHFYHNYLKLDAMTAAAYLGSHLTHKAIWRLRTRRQVDPTPWLLDSAHEVGDE